MDLLSSPSSSSRVTEDNVQRTSSSRSRPIAPVEKRTLHSCTWHFHVVRHTSPRIARKPTSFRTAERNAAIFACMCPAYVIAYVDTCRGERTRRRRTRGARRVAYEYTNPRGFHNSIFRERAISLYSCFHSSQSSRPTALFFQRGRIIRVPLRVRASRTFHALCALGTKLPRASTFLTLFNVRYNPVVRGLCNPVCGYSSHRNNAAPIQSVTDRARGKPRMSLG